MQNLSFTQRIMKSKELNGFYCEKADRRAIATVVSSNLTTVPFGFKVIKVNGIPTETMTMHALTAIMLTKLSSYEVMSEGYSPIFLMPSTSNLHR